MGIDSLILGFAFVTLGFALVCGGQFCLIFFDCRDRIGGWFDRIGNKGRVALGFSLIALAILVTSYGAILVMGYMSVEVGR